MTDEVDPARSRIVTDCQVCEWNLPVRAGFSGQAEADRYLADRVNPHVVEQGHTVRMLIATTTGDLVERTTFTFRPTEAAPAKEEPT